MIAFFPIFQDFKHDQYLERKFFYCILRMNMKNKQSNSSITQEKKIHFWGSLHSDKIAIESVMNFKSRFDFVFYK